MIDSATTKRLQKFSVYLSFRSLILRTLYNKSFIEKALLTLELAKKALDLLEIEFWLDSGTCLGAIRERNFISYDNDIDLGIKEEYESHMLAIIRELGTKGFSFVTLYRDTKTGKGVNLHFCRENIRLDIFVYYAKGEFVWMGSYDPSGRMVPHVFSKALFDNLKEINFLKLRVKVPNPVEAYLTQAYGDWQIVRRDWQYFRDSPCSRPNFLNE